MCILQYLRISCRNLSPFIPSSSLEGKAFFSQEVGPEQQPGDADSLGRTLTSEWAHFRTQLPGMVSLIDILMHISLSKPGWTDGTP